jgi:two-component sensor histidine kinase
VAAERILNVIPTDIGRPIGHLNLNVPIPDLEALILEVIDSMNIKEREVQDREGHWYCLRIRPYRTSDNRIDGAMLLYIDIDSLKDVDRLSTLLAEVDTARHFSEGVVQTAPWPLLILNRQVHVIGANPAFYQFFQTTMAETEQRPLYTLGNGQWDIPELRRVLETILTPNAPVYNSEVTHTFPQIGKRTLLLNARRIRRDGKETETILLGLQDITQHRQTEARLVAALREKDVILREVSHRIKNNLQIVSSLLGLQADAVEEQPTRELFEESQRRIQAMALLHQKLYGAEDFRSIDAEAYVRSLMEDLARMYDPEGRIALDIEADGSINTDTAIACGLIVTELVSNAFKYAFPESQPGRIRVALRPESENQWLLEVQDNGIGLPSDIGMAHVTSIGLSLVRDLAGQLEGNVLINRNQGTTFTMQFPSVRHTGA